MICNKKKYMDFGTVNNFQKLLLIITAVLLFQWVAIPVFADSDLTIEVNESTVDFPDAKPFIDTKSNRTMIPIRFVSEKLGAKVTWDGSLRVVGIHKSEKTIKIKIGDSFALVDGEKIQIDASSVIISDRTYVPLRFVSEVLGAKVGWNSETRTVSISAALIDEDLQKKLESVLNNYISSYKTGNLEATKEYVSTYNYAAVKNSLLSAGMTSLPYYPEMVESMDITNDKLYRVFENGPTIGLIYERKPDSESGQEDEKTFVFFKFVKEDSHWKYDSVKTQSPKPFSDEEIIENINGKVITNIPIIDNVEVPKSYLSINFASGYNVSVSINNRKPIVVNEGSHIGLIIGGLKKAANTLDIEITPIEEKSSSFFFPEIEIYYLDDTNSKIVVYSNEDSEETGKMNKTIQVNP